MCFSGRDYPLDKESAPLDAIKPSLINSPISASPSGNSLVPMCFSGRDSSGQPISPVGRHLSPAVTIPWTNNQRARKTPFKPSLINSPISASPTGISLVPMCFSGRDYPLDKQSAPLDAIKPSLINSPISASPSGISLVPMCFSGCDYPLDKQSACP
ncbi:unnamed protein product [Fasciola hepatica]|uniref:Uncharacterized protein n=1 Tax=Fasciola hepatica TaxID=6192 RepID=A0ABC9HJ36_FASHE